MTNKPQGVLYQAILGCAVILLILGRVNDLTALTTDGLNPAELSLLANSETYNYSLKYLNVQLDFSNNSLGVNQLINNFIKDNEWDSIQKATIFAKIVSSFFSVNRGARLTPIMLSTRLFNMSVRYHELIAIVIPKDLVDLMFWGNNLNRSYDLANFSFNRMGYYDWSVGVTYPIVNNKIAESKLNNITMGINIHWLKGRYVIQTDSAFGSVLTTPNVLNGEMRLFQQTAKGGNCWTIDVGTKAQFLRSLSVGFAVLNLNTGFNWTSESKSRVLSLTLDSFSLQRYLDYGSLDSVYRKYDSLKPQRGFKTHLPVQILVQTAYQPTWLITLKTSYYQFLTENYFTDNLSRRLNCGFYFNFTKCFASELSFATDLKQNFAVGTDFYITVKGFNFSLLISQLNGLFQRAKGLGVDISFGQNW